ncbi:MAG: DUF1330 domain-containing protein [Pseudomonadota bacterium]
MMAAPAFLIVRSKAPASRFHAFCRANAGGAGAVFAARPVEDVCALEPGSVPLNTWIAKYGSLDEAKAAWSGMDAAALAEPEPPLVLAANAVPDEGLPPELDFVPTHTNVEAPPGQPPTLMVIEGSASDPDEMDKYRDIILPMMRERGAYYLCFQIGGDVEVLSGTWSEGIFAISRWSDAHLARDFWLSPRYQDDAIPIRINIGSFQVVTLEGERDDG